ncbi:PMM-domain-containing protein [Aspergillus costaricaensis CBS 115574]|uniref:PMM-domain-containing protein n=1 Tax=Aspergillus costaricaensis CBS 115574 TaxID=1448317 RepID=A0ACD1HZ41_9EURO|nr:PMM-domain-containing protein [Aspergillus costaricaensis CBS 115574]RAK83248.1 PMM-domain-containing protein [Aspergillus costaricaensis CBS 115574]
MLCSELCRESLKSHPDRVPVDSPERAARTRKFQEISDAYYTLSDVSRRREYDAMRMAGGVEEEEEEVPRGGAGGFPWSAFGFGTGTGTADSEQRANEQFGSVFEEMLREEGLASEGTDADGQTRSHPTSRFWSVVANAPGALAGAVAGNRLGAVRDAKGKSVYDVFLQLPQTDRARLLSELAAKDRPLKGTICLFDVDKTLTPARANVTPEMLTLLSQLRHKCAIGFVGGSNLPKQQEQLGRNTTDVTTLFDFCFAENGLTAFRLGKPLQSNSFIQWLGEEKYQKLVNFLLKYIANLELPKKRGTFVEFRNGMINVSPIGRNASTEERKEFEAYDKIHNIRRDLVDALKKEFPDYGLSYSIGGEISFDVFPTGWDKTYCLQHVEAEKDITGIDYKTIHFFGDKTFPGGNDYEIYSDPRTIGHSVEDPDDTMRQLRELFQL